MKKHKEPSDYTVRGYAGLHIKKETHQRLNFAKAHVRATAKRFVSQDEFINLLLDHYGAPALEIVMEQHP